MEECAIVAGERRKRRYKGQVEIFKKIGGVGCNQGSVGYKSPNIYLICQPCEQNQVNSNSWEFESLTLLVEIQ